MNAGAPLYTRATIVPQCVWWERVWVCDGCVAYLWWGICGGGVLSVCVCDLGLWCVYCVSGEGHVWCCVCGFVVAVWCMWWWGAVCVCMCGFVGCGVSGGVLCVCVVSVWLICGGGYSGGVLCVGVCL